MKSHFVPHRERSVLPLERPVGECCVGRGWFFCADTHTAHVMCIYVVKNQNITLKTGLRRVTPRR
jgi:hypothetical protein